ncbi:MAG: CDP-diacylglycerol--serine O-phosphatidyltransferase [Geminicoccaceae bacterium]
MLPRRRRGKRLRAQPLIHLLPNMFTVLSLCAGLTSIRYALDGRFELAVALIVAAAVLDGLDGRSARLLKISSKLGAQLDSLADFLSFGVAPAILVYLWSLNQVPALGWALALLFATCCALRLARFNTELELTDRPPWMSRFFTGMPAPAAAGCALIPLLLAFAFQADWPRNWVLNAVVLIAVAFLMVSRIPTFSIKTLVVRVKPDWILPTLIGVGLFVAALSSAPWHTLLAIGVVYLVSLPIGWWSAYRLRRRDQAERAADAAAASGEAPRIVSFGGQRGTRSEAP